MGEEAACRGASTADDRGQEAAAVGRRGAAVFLLESAVTEVYCCWEGEARRSPDEAPGRSLQVGEGELRVCLDGRWVEGEHRPGWVWVQTGATADEDPHGTGSPGWAEECWEPEEGLLESPVWRNDSDVPSEDRGRRLGRQLGLLGI